MLLQKACKVQLTVCCVILPSNILGAMKREKMIFPTFILIPMPTVNSFYLFTFFNVNMTGDPLHTASKGRMAPKNLCDHFASRCVPQLSVIKLP